MMCQQAATDYACDMMQKGEWDAAEANVMVVRMMGWRLIESPLSRDVRSALNAAVKAGRLGRIKKDGLRPEVYHHPNSRPHALDARDKRFREKVEPLKTVFAS